MNAENKSTTAKPRIGGSVFRAKTGTELPSDAKSVLNEAFLSLGYISEDGVKNGFSPSSNPIKSWGGGTVLDIQESRPDTFKFTMIEAMEPEVLKTVFGNKNVEGTLDTCLKVKANDKELEYAAYVIDMILKNNILKRIVIPRAKVSNVEEITYAGNNAITYGVTLSASLNDQGDYHYEYLQNPTEG